MLSQLPSGRCQTAIALPAPSSAICGAGLAVVALAASIGPAVPQPEPAVYRLAQTLNSNTGPPVASAQAQTTVALPAASMAICGALASPVLSFSIVTGAPHCPVFA